MRTSPGYSIPDTRTDVTFSSEWSGKAGIGWYREGLGRHDTRDPVTAAATALLIGARTPEAAPIPAHSGQKNDVEDPKDRVDGKVVAYGNPAPCAVAGRWQLNQTEVS